MSLQKQPRYENPKLLKLANGMACTGCDNDDGTTVMAHSDFAIHGKAKGMKASDVFVAAICYTCHTWLGSGTNGYVAGGWAYPPTREGKMEFFRRAHEKTMLELWRAGKVKVA